MPDDRDDWDDFDDRPRRRRSNAEPNDEPVWGDERDDYDDGGGRPNPADRVCGPGTALAVVGWVGLVGTVLTLVLLLVVGLNDPPPGDELIVNVVVGGVIGALGLAYFAVIAAGGHRIRQCRRYGLAMTAAILATTSIALIGVCSVVILPFGIWAVVVLAQSDVRRAFARPRSSYD